MYSITPGEGTFPYYGNAQLMLVVLPPGGGGVPPPFPTFGRCLALFTVEECCDFCADMYMPVHFLIYGFLKRGLGQGELVPGYINRGALPMTGVP